jgi:flagellar operon protein
MDNKIQNSRISELLQGGQAAPTKAPDTTAGADFAAILQDRLKVSGHAQTRLQSRNIALDSDQWDRVVGGVERAAAKGAKESLVMVDNAALVVSVKNRTVITAVDQAQLKENVFTNIDSAVIV